MKVAFWVKYDVKLTWSLLLVETATISDFLDYQVTPILKVDTVYPKEDFVHWSQPCFNVLNFY